MKKAGTDTLWLSKVSDLISLYLTGAVSDFSKQTACAVEFLNTALGFRVFRLNTSEACRSESSFIFMIVDGMKSLIPLADSIRCSNLPDVLEKSSPV